MAAVSEILTNMFLKVDLIEKMIEEFGSKFKAEAVEVIDDNSLIIGSFYKRGFANCNIINPDNTSVRRL